MKGAKGKAPSYQMYPMDWNRDLEEHPLFIEGAWIRICNKLWFEKERGVGIKTIGQWAKLLGVPKRLTKRILKYIDDERIGDIFFPEMGGCHGKVTVVSRRMVRDQKQRDNWRKRKEKQREKESKKTPSRESHAPSSISSSISSSTSKEVTPPKSPHGGNGSVLKTYPYPDWLNKSLWQDFHRMRSRIRKPVTTEKTITGLMNKLKSITGDGHSQDEIIQLAIDNCWLTFYPPKKKDSEEYIV